MRFLRSRRGLAAIAALLAILFLFRPGVYRLRNRISNSIGAAIGRRVAIDNVRFHVLPRPGFDLEGFVIYDDPAFGAEPMIRAQDVFAAIRLRSVLYGRLEIATLSATEPSINLVRNNEGRWNLSTLIERNAQIPAAPTQKTTSEQRPAFPYLEASNARVNFKVGQVKKAYALVDADVALWQDSENSWSARVKAQPTRTDSNLTDTGQLQINATWQRAPSLRQTPMHVTAAWQKGQLGQITKLITGRDRGWRGGVDLSATFDGIPEAFATESTFAIDGFHRYDIVNSRIVRLSTHCSARYNAMAAAITELACDSPVGNGALRLSGNITITAQPAYDLTLAADKVPVSTLAGLAHQAKQQLPADLSAEGMLSAEFHARRNADGSTQWSGNGAATEVKLRSNGGRDTIGFNNVPLVLVSDTSKPVRSPFSARIKAGAKEADLEPAEPHLRIGPSALTVNNSAAISAGGWIALASYRFFLRGDVDLKNLFRVENAFGVPATHPAAEGAAALDLSISGPWQGLAPANAFGSAQLKNVRAEMLGLNAPIEIASATVVLGPDMTAVQKINAHLGETHWSGSVRAPRHCAPNCLYQFDLGADKLSTPDLAGWLAPHAAKRPWYRILTSTQQQGPSPLLNLQAHGTLHVNQFVMKKAVATQVSTDVTADRGKITLTDLRAKFLQGTHQGNWTVDAFVQPLRLHGGGALQNVSLEQVSNLMNDAWITGIADGTFDVTTSGPTFPDMLASAEGKLDFSVRNGSFAHVAIPGAPVPFTVHRFTGNLRVKDRKWQLSAGRLESRDGFYQVSGVSSPTGGLDFIFTRGDEQSWNVTGTISKPHASPTTRTEARARSAARP